MNPRSINTRLMTWFAGLTLITVTGFGCFAYVSFGNSLHAEMASMLDRRLIHLREDISKVLATNTTDSLAKEIDNIYSPEENDRFIRIRKANGELLYLSRKPREGDFDPQQIPDMLGYTDSISAPIVNFWASNHLMLKGYRTDINGTSYILEMGLPTKPIDTALSKLAATLLCGLPFVVLVSLVGGRWLLRRALQPVESLRASAEIITFSNLRQRLPVTNSGDEIESLARTLNQMLERLEHAYQQANRFSAEASHELRTPLAVLRSEIEGLAQGSVEVQEIPERMESVIEEVEYLSNIVKGLFDLARLDAGEAKASDEVLDLSDLVGATIEQMRLLADDKNLSISLSAQKGVLVRGDATRLRRVTVNLFDNAIKYTPSGGNIRIDVHAANAKAILSMTDDGIGIPPDAGRRLFERFYRNDNARGFASGAGLGLSIVQAICDAHGGSVRLEPAGDKGTRAVIELPLALPLKHL